jgi:F-type H+-transporting ATPase subunit b
MNHYILFASLGSELAESAKGTAERFGLDFPHFIAQVVSFSLVCLCLRLFAYKPILKMLAERRQQISDGLANAEKIKQELARTEAMRQEVLDAANVQATKLIEEARAAAARVRDQETQKAIAEAEQIIAKARQATVMEHGRMLAELKQEVLGLVSRATAAVTGKVLTADDQQRLAEETRRQLAA